MDPVNKVLKFTSHNRWALLAALLISLALGFVSCKSTTMSLVTPGEQVGAVQFESEVAQRRGEIEASVAAIRVEAETLNAQAEIGRADIAQQDNIKLKLLDVVGENLPVMLSYTGLPAPLVATVLGFSTTALGVLAVALGLDKRRAHKKIVKLENGVKPPPVT